MKALSINSCLFMAIMLLANLRARTQTCTLKCPANMIVKADSGQGGTAVTFTDVVTTGNCRNVTFSPASGSFFRIGSNSVIAAAASGQKCSFTVTVTDNEPPVLSELTISPQRLWPADKGMKEVAVSYTSSDNSGETACTLTVRSNDPGQGGGWEIVSNRLVRLKALRLPDGKPRIYTIKVSCTDPSGNTTSRTTAIGVSANIVAKEQERD